MATSSAPLSVPDVTLAVARGNAPPVGSFVPLYKQDFAAGVVGQSDPDWRMSEFTDTRSLSGTQCVKMSPNRGPLPPACGGGHFFANNQAMHENAGMAAEVPVGNTIWYRMFFYFPPTFSFGYLYAAGNAQDDADSTACGNANDMGLSGIKWMNLDSEAIGGKVYTKIPSARRKVAQPSGADPEYPDITIENEAGGGAITASGSPVPLDQWFSMQLGIKVATDNTGFIRLWLGADLVAEQLNVRTIPTAGTAIKRWGLGDYWNGIPYTDGAAGRDDFFVDEIVIASDLAGYGAPTGVDAFGNTFIDPATRAGDLA